MEIKKSKERIVREVFFIPEERPKSIIVFDDDNTFFSIASDHFPELHTGEKTFVMQQEFTVLRVWESGKDRLYLLKRV